MSFARQNGGPNPPTFTSAHKDAPLWLLLPATPAILLGVVAMRQKGIEPLVWGQNLAAWLSATAFCLLVLKMGLPRTLNSVPGLVTMPLGFLVLLTTFCFPGLAGVHRWLVFGSVRLHAGELLLPMMLIGLTLVREQRLPFAWLFTLLTAALLVFQPDAAQATAFSIPAAVLLLKHRGTRSTSKWMGLSALFGLVVAAWIRRDPLDSVPHVEGIVGLVANLGSIWAFVAVSCLAFLPVPFLVFYIRQRGRRTGDAALALVIYFTLSLVVCVTGSFPVPLMGYGISPFVGYYTSIVWLFAHSRLGNCETSNETS